VSITRSTMIKIPVAGTYSLDLARSSIDFTTRHIFGLGKVKGSFALAEGEAAVTDPVMGSSVSATALASSFSSGFAKRDKDVKSRKFLDAKKFPDIQFRSTGLANEDSQWLIRGEITAHGVTAPVELKVSEVSTDANSLTLRATGRVDRYAHGVTGGKGIAARYLDLNITARAVRI
jgi:polyisoprenoid-binding protein YceI